jgi:nitroreductase
MKATKLLAKRHSVSKLTEPAPDAETLDTILRNALRAPDHGALTPWKILVFRGDGRKRLGSILGEALLLQMPDASAEDVTKARSKVERAPLLLAVVANIKPSKKIPEIEQMLSAGCVMYGLHLGLAAEGFGSVWKTGAPCYDPFVRERLGLAPTDHIVGFLYVGTPAEEPAEAKRPDPEDFVVTWGG